MSLFQFETTLEENDVIHLPPEIAEQLERGSKLQVSIAPITTTPMSPDEAWKAILADIEARKAQRPSTPPEPFTWTRDDLYDHLKKYYADSTD